MTTADRRLDVSRSSGSGSGSGNKTARIGRPEEPQPQPPFVDRRRPNGIWSLITLALVMAQLQLFAHSGGGGCGVSAAPAHHSPTAPTAAPSASHLLNPSKHLQKRSQAVTLPLSFRQTLNASSTQLDWENTCHMKPTGLNEAHSKAKRCKKRQKILQKLQNQTGRELKAIQDEDRARSTINADHPFTNNTKTLDIVDKNKWRLHTENYSFLPRLNVTSKQLNLRHAHRDLQFYVGAFSYMRNIQWYWDVTIRQARTVLTDELGRLRKSAQAVLCSVEEAINVTNLLYTPRRTRAQQQPRGQKKRRQVQPVVTYKILPRKLMEKRLLQFNSTEAPLVELHHNATLAARGVHVALPPDNLMGLEQHALFTKLKFVQFLKGIRKILARQRRSLCKATAKGASKAIPMKEESRK
ncbi:uncharacterized protein LOC122624140 [Drosophila teissieri]|uniref:uncharacterized protein LOC122624140 n=1 Tax=Drosophila teissieri TaxID=7243 RepID=UPI001CB9F795|nr:uncharacterized protein LOC122624140 [Drosophila teissieri]